MTQPAEKKPFYTYLREERQFSFLLAFFLMQRGPALGQFLELAESRNNTSIPARASEGMEDAEVYVEFAPLRDRRAALLSDESASGRVGPAERLRANVSKRAFVAELLKSVPSLAPTAELATHESIADFNAFFMGESGRRITRDIASPALWSVASLEETAQGNPQVFKDLCRLKWAFHIKPDVVILRRGLPSVCVEAKLEGTEGSYPTSKADIAVFDRVVGSGSRVGQLGLQVFLLETLLKTPCLPVVVQKLRPAIESKYPVLTLGGDFQHVLRQRKPNGNRDPVCEPTDEGEQIPDRVIPRCQSAGVGSLQSPSVGFSTGAPAMPELRLDSRQRRWRPRKPQCSMRRIPSRCSNGYLLRPRQT